MQGLTDVQPFAVALDSPGTFQHSKAVGWLGPRSSAQVEALRKLQSRLVDLFPECTELSANPRRRITAFQPHLTLGQWPDAGSAQRALLQRQVRGSMLEHA